MIKGKIKSLNSKYFPQHLFYAPEWLVLGVNNACNLHCKMCDVGVGYTSSNFATNLLGSKPLNMPIDLLKKVIDETATYFPHTKLGYASTEPLVYTYLEESLKYAQYKNLYTAITTNALVLPQKAKMLCEAGLNEISISLDGTQNVHNEIRGNAKSFQQAIKGIEALLEEKNTPDISVYFVITEWNIDEMVTFAEFFKPYPLKRLGFMHTNFTTKAGAELHNSIWGEHYHATLSNTQEINVEQMNLPHLMGIINKIKQSQYPYEITFSPNITSLQALEKYYLKPELFYGNKCHDVNRNIMIKSDGSVIPSHGRCYNLTIGNLYQQNLKEVWNSDIIKKLRTDLNKAGGLFPACSRCCSAL
ncbi:MAG: radical SAM protein [Bacteroidia bacterium]|jgi:MoaA/NifB/PqqE/SkfB family radical SAM enzyme|nr:radical SAM protein [Bacteroidia bacterium]